jgi:hypothetical protein
MGRAEIKKTRIETVLLFKEVLPPANKPSNQNKNHSLFNIMRFEETTVLENNQPRKQSIEGEKEGPMARKNKVHKPAAAVITDDYRRFQEWQHANPNKNGVFIERLEKALGMLPDEVHYLNPARTTESFIRLKEIREYLELRMAIQL